MSQPAQVDLDNDTGEIATDYAIDIDMASNEMRIQHCDEDGVICTQVLTAPEAYTYAQKILRGYDRLEGID